MKIDKIYFIILIILFINAFYLYIQHDNNIDYINHNYHYKDDDIKPLKFSLDFNKSSYLFKNSIWDIKYTKSKEDLLREKLLNSKLENNITKTLPITLNLKSIPIKICESSKCYELIGTKNNSVVFYGKKDGFKKSFIDLKKGEYLDKRIILKEIERDKIILYDIVLKRELDIKMFYVDMSKYRAKKKLIGDKNEK